ncbi:sulfatase [Phragmitibacter flavus]|uniref:Sulfatase n=2 Tax=Phragmitibacter flavus TaxID=2576071 RepID=A0A5R8KKS5_9BACT|nr:sulfatase [Phragmitibacter flavus]
MLVLLLNAALISTGGAAEQKPNIIVINIDDLGYADIGPFGSTTKTPHLDRMAAEGRKLMSHYAAPVCSPSRAALMTGCYPKRALPIPHVLFPAAAVGLHPDEVTMADVLKEAGYATACIGKWHLGDQPEFLPTRQGFDYFYGIPYSNDMGTVADGAKNNPGEPPPKPRARPRPKQNPNPNQSPNLNVPPRKDDETGIKATAQPPLPLLRNEQVINRVKAEQQYELTLDYTMEAREFIEQNKDRPFFLYLPHSAVHFPIYPREEFAGKSPNGAIGDWAMEVDWSVGQVLDLLRELKLDQKTLVIFTSDNGGSVRHGSKNGPLRGGKAETWEGGMRVGTIAWWPGKIPAGTSTDEITSMMDLLPTVARLGGVELSADRKIDGVDIWPVLAGTVDGKAPRDHFFYYRGFRMEAVRFGPWKLHLDKKQLYHLGDDLGEQNDVYGQHPEVVEKLQQLALTMEDDLGLDGVGPGCRPLGRVVKPLPLIDLEGVVREGMTMGVNAVRFE